METIEIFGFVGAFLIGVILGLIGGGGSILTVPVLVYLMYINPVTATAYSLFVVGFAALIGAIQNMKKGLVDFRTAIVFSIPAFIAVYTTRRFIVPAIPDELVSIGSFIITKNIGIMLFFAFIMLLASVSMIGSNSKERETEEKPRFNYPLIVLEGLIVGLLTGIVGAGGVFNYSGVGFNGQITYEKAVATSLLIIAIKSLIGFCGDVETLEIDWAFLLFFTVLSVLGIFVGIWLSKFIDGNKLKKGFGWFVLVMAVYIIIKEFTS